MKLSTLYCRQMICSWWHSSYFLLPCWTNYIKLSLATYLLNFTTQKPGCSLSRAVLAAGWSVRSVIHLCETLIVLFEASEGRPAIRNVMLRSDADIHSQSCDLTFYCNILLHLHFFLSQRHIWKASTSDPLKSSFQATLLNIKWWYECCQS